MANIYGVVQGSDPGVIVISNHYDTKLFDGFRFVGANDGGSTTAWMLEMARTLGPKRQGHTIWLVFFDGEEALVKWSKSDSLYGSREFVEKHIDNGNRDDIRLVINVDMIGDCYLGISGDPDAPRGLTDLIWQKANELAYGAHFLPFGLAGLQDDHIPFRLAGVHCINLIDFSYGGSQVEHRQNWHTARDTLDKVCWQSLQAVGDVIYDALPEIDSYLSASGSRGP